MIRPPSINLYLGSPIEQRSEKQALQAIYERLDEEGTDAVILANAHIFGRQVDLLVATARSATVIEVKSFSRETKGEMNGVWESKQPSGKWKGVGNPYQQALAAKNSVKDSISHLMPAVEPKYPTALVAIVPNSPTGSTHTLGDFKVRVVDLNALPQEVTRHHSQWMPLDSWRKFATALGMYQVTSLEHALHPDLAVHDSSVSSYLDRLNQVLQGSATHHADVFQSQAGSISSDDASSNIVQFAQNFLLLGPSGCGKTLFTNSLASRIVESGGVPILLAARDFEGNLGNLLDRECSLLGLGCFRDLLTATRRLEIPLSLMVDGFNECPSSLRLNLTRALAAVTAKIDCQLVISSTSPLPAPSLISHETLTFQRPSRDLKRLIAVGHGAAPDRLDSLSVLDLATSGFDAALIGETLTELPNDPRRFDVVDTYIRRRLQISTSSAIVLLCEFADQLRARLTFVSPFRELERAAHKLSLNPGLCEVALRSGLLAMQDGKVRFAHELLLRHFQAEALVRRTSGNYTALAELASETKNSDLGINVIEAIPSPIEMDVFIGNVSSSSILRLALDGSGGTCAVTAARHVCSAAFEALRRESATFRLNPVTKCVEFDRPKLSKAEAAAVPLLGKWVSDTASLDLVLEITFASDIPALELRSNVVLTQLERDNAFSSLFVSSGPGSSLLSHLLAALRQDAWRAAASPALEAQIIAAWQRPCSAPELYCLTEISRSRNIEEIASMRVAQEIQFNWSQHPYHLRLALVHFLHSHREISPATSRAAINALETLLPRANAFFSGMVLEAIGAQGGLEDQEHDYEQTVTQEIASALSDDSRNAAISAWFILSSQFDHPYSNAYAAVVTALPEEDRRNLLELALFGGDSSSDFFLSCLLREMSDLGGPGNLEAYMRWTAPPPTDSFLRQEAFEVFALAHAALANAPDRFSLLQSDERAPLQVFGEMIYAASGARTQQSIKRIQSCASTLHSKHLSLALDLLYLFDHCSRHRFCSEPDRVASEFLWGSARSEFLAICRESIDAPHMVSTYFQHSQEDLSDLLAFAAETIGRIGDNSDLSRLRTLAQSDRIYHAATTAIATLERGFG